MTGLGIRTDRGSHGNVKIYSAHVCKKRRRRLLKDRINELMIKKECKQEDFSYSG